MPLSADTLEAAYPAAELLDLVGCYISRRSGIRVFELRCGRVFVQPGSLEPGATGGGKFGLGIIERADEAVGRTGAVLDAIEPPIPLIAGRIAAGLVDRADTDLARVDLETVGAVVGFMAELEHQCLYKHAPTRRNAAQSFCYDGFGHDAPFRGASWQVPARRFRHATGRGAYDGFV